MKILKEHSHDEIWDRLVQYEGDEYPFHAETWCVDEQQWKMVYRYQDRRLAEADFEHDITMCSCQSKCVVCGETTHEICCSLATYNDGTHVEPVCIDCCRCKNTPKIWDGKSVAGGTYRRGE